MTDKTNLLAMSDTPTRRQAIVGVAAFAAFTLGSTTARDAAEDEISRTAETIHQEPVFQASRKRVYEALLDSKQFDKVVELSGVMKSGMLPPGTNKPTEISRDLGGAFAIFGGYITGRHLELLPDQRIVQAWRVGSWGPGIYSLARFAFLVQGSGTKIVFDHSSFPKGDAEHLAAGWRAHYWEPLAKLLS